MSAVFQATIDDASGSESSLNLGIVSDWPFREESLLQPITSTTQIWVMTSHQYGISAHVAQTSFSGETPWWRREMSAVLQATIDNASGSEGSLKRLKISLVDVVLYNHR